MEGQSAGKAQGAFEVGSIRSELGWYLAGFADGEGSFNVSFRPREDYVFQWKVSLCFNISQRDPTVPKYFKECLGCGTMRQRHDGEWYYEVNDLRSLRQRVLPFFGRFGFLSAKKQRDFGKFVQLCELMHEGRHLSFEGVLEVIRIRSNMNDGGKRRWTDREILFRLENPQRLHARHRLRR